MITRDRHRPFTLIVMLALVLSASLSASESGDDPFKDAGKTASELIPAGWIGSPVSLASVRGNTIVIAFWNADIPC